MINWIKTQWKKRFQKKPKAILIDNTFKIVPAFELKGITYYMHEDPISTATGRGLSAMQFIDELTLRCSDKYLNLHLEACDKIFSNPKKIDFSALVQLHNNLKERVRLLTVMPEHVYKLASVVFFRKDESPFKYNKVQAERNIAEWRASPDMLDFFLQTPLKTLIPFLSLPENNSQDYLKVTEKLNQIHLKNLSGILSKSVSESDT